MQQMSAFGPSQNSPSQPSMYGRPLAPPAARTAPSGRLPSQPSPEAFLDPSVLIASINGSLEPQNLGIPPGLTIETYNFPVDGPRDAKLRFFEADARRIGLLSLERRLEQSTGVDGNDLSSMLSPNLSVLLIHPKINVQAGASDLIVSTREKLSRMQENHRHACDCEAATRKKMKKGGNQHLADTLRAWAVEKLFWEARYDALQHLLGTLQQLRDFEANTQPR